MIAPQVKTIASHLGTGLGVGVAVVAYMADHKVDLYAIWDQLNVVFASITKLIATVTPIATGAYAIYRSSNKVRATEVMQDPKSIEVAESLPVTPTTVAVADALKKQ